MNCKVVRNIDNGNVRWDIINEDGIVVASSTLSNEMADWICDELNECYPDENEDEDEDEDEDDDDDEDEDED